jgi:hypothetical protein
MENKKNNQFYKKFEESGQFPTDSHGKIINNRTTGYDTSKLSFEMYKKTIKEKLDVSIAKSKWKNAMKVCYGKNWKKHNNPISFQ